MCSQIQETVKSSSPEIDLDAGIEVVVVGPRHLLGEDGVVEGVEIDIVGQLDVKICTDAKG